MNSIVIPHEHEEQVTFIEYAQAKLPHHLYSLLWATPNGGVRHMGTAIKLKAEGVKAGVPDITFAYPRGKYHGLFIEMKRRKLGRLSPEQSSFIEALRGVGYKVEVCKGCDCAIEVLNNYLSLGEK